MPWVHCGKLCLAVGASQKSYQTNLPWILALGTAVWAMQTTLSFGRESLELGIDQPSPSPFPSRPWQGPSLAWLRAACSPGLADSQHLPYFTGQGGWQCTRAGLTSAATRLGKGERRVSREACSLTGRGQVKAGHVPAERRWRCSVSEHLGALTPLVHALPGWPWHTPTQSLVHPSAANFNVLHPQCPAWALHSFSSSQPD